MGTYHRHPVVRHRAGHPDREVHPGSRRLDGLLDALRVAGVLAPLIKVLLDVLAEHRP